MNIERIGVICDGSPLGTKIARVALTAGYEVVLHDGDRDRLDKMPRAVLNQLWNTLQARHGERAHHEWDETAASRLRKTHSLRGLCETHFIIGALFNPRSIVRTMFANLDNLCCPETIFVTTSDLFPTQPISPDVAAATNRPDKFVGMGFSIGGVYIQTISSCSTPTRRRAMQRWEQLLPLAST